jgi:hypothetical protein
VLERLDFMLNINRPNSAPHGVYKCYD